LDKYDVQATTGPHILYGTHAYQKKPMLNSSSQREHEKLKLKLIVSYDDHITDLQGKVLKVSPDRYGSMQTAQHSPSPLSS